MRLIELLVLIGIGYFLFNLFKPRQQPPSGGGENRRMDGENMVRCSYCGLHVPQSQVVWRDGRPYCSTEHSRHDS